MENTAISTGNAKERNQRIDAVKEGINSNKILLLKERKHVYYSKGSS